MEKNEDTSNNTNSLLIKILAASVFLTPLVVLPLKHESFEVPKTYFLYLASITLIIIALFRDSNNTEKYFKRFFSFLPVKLAFLFIVSNLISSYFGLDFSHSLFGSYYRKDGIFTLLALFSLPFFTFMAVAPIGEDKDRCSEEHSNGIEKIIDALINSGLTVSVIGILQFILRMLKMLPSSLLYDSRITSTLGQANFLGGFLASVYPFVLLKDDKTPKLNVCKIIFPLTIILTFSKGSILAMSAMLILKNIQKLKNMGKQAVVLLCLIIFFIGLLVFTRSLEPIHNNFKSSKYYQLQRLTFFLSPTSFFGEKRIQIYEVSWQAFTTRPFLGFGKGNIDEALHPYINNSKELRGLVIDSSHNLFMDTLLEGGVVSLAILLLFYVTLLKSVGPKKAVRQCVEKGSGNRNSLNSKALKLSIVSILIYSLFNNTSVTIFLTQALVLGLAVKLSVAKTQGS